MTDEQLDDRLDARLRTAGERWRAVPAAAITVTARPPIPRRPWLLIASAAVVVAALVTGGVALWSNDSSSDSPMAQARRGGGTLGTATWHIRSFLPATRTGNMPADHDEPVDTSAGLRFQHGKFSGSDGCNEIFGRARVHRDTITFGDLGGTQVACSGSTGAFEAKVTSVLRGTVHYSATATALVITKDGVGTLFASHDTAPSRRSVELVGTWVLTGTQTVSKDGSTGSGSSVSPTGDANRLKLSVNAFSYVATCLSVNGRVTTDRTTLTFEAADPTFRSCPLSARPNDAQNAFVRAVLSGRTSWEIDGASLRITNGTRGLDFERAN